MVMQWVCGRTGVHGQLFLTPNATWHGLWNLIGQSSHSTCHHLGVCKLRLLRLLNSHHPIPFPSPGPKLDWGPGTLFHFDSNLSVLRTS